MAKKSLVIEILGNNKMGRAVRDAMGSLKRLGHFAAGIGRGIAKAFKFGAVGVVAAAGLMGLAIRKAFSFEAYEVQLKVLLGSMEAAKEAFKTLADFSARTPFQLDGIIEAYQQLQTFTDGALNTERGLKLVGDAAAGRGKDFAEVAYWVGRLYSALKNGDPFMDSVSALQRLGIVGGTIRGDLEDLTKTGVNFGGKWAVVEQQLGRFEGGMDDLSRTGSGLFSTMKDNWNLSLATFGNAFMNLAKGAIKTLIDVMSKLRADGSIEKWAAIASTAVGRVSDAVAGMFGTKDEREAAMADLKSMFDTAGTYIKPKFEEWGEAAGAAIWRGFKKGGEKVGTKLGAKVDTGLLSSTWKAFDPMAQAVGSSAAFAGKYSGERALGKSQMSAAASGLGASLQYQANAFAQPIRVLVQNFKDMDGVSN